MSGIFEGLFWLFVVWFIIMLAIAVGIVSVRIIEWLVEKIL